MQTNVSFLKTLLIFCALAVGAAVAVWLRPDQMLADELPPIALKTTIPVAFGDWKEETARNNQIVSPETQAVLDSLYSELLSRTYVNSKGQRIMMSIAYGRNQGDEKAVHYPEVCYPAQGFKVVRNVTSKVSVNGHDIAAKRLVATMGGRWEPITYWATVGDKVVLGGIEHKLAQLSYGFKGKVPDGMIFRISTIGRDHDSEWEVQNAFVGDLSRALNVDARPRFIGRS